MDFRTLSERIGTTLFIIGLALFICTLLGACGTENLVNIKDSKHRIYVSVAETYRELCDDKFNEFDYSGTALDRVRAACYEACAGEDKSECPVDLGGVELPNLDGL